MCIRDRSQFIYANSHFIQNLNTLVDTPTFIIDERILDYPELYQVKTLLAEMCIRDSINGIVKIILNKKRA